jgi:glycerol-3-phosphate acyltransferase PlsY
MPVAMLVVGYLLGSIPFGVVLTRLAGAGDLRAIGSGSIGATNVLRTGHKGLAAFTVIFDAGKGAVAVALAQMLAPDCVGIAAAAAFIGHLYPVWLGFRGGKGIATMLGIALALDWRIGLIVGAAWLGGALLTRVSSMGGMISALAAPLAAWVLGRLDLVPLFLAFLVLVLWKHRGNIARLVAGTEPRIGEGK